MSWKLLVGALGVGAALLSGSEPDHDETVEETYNTLRGAVPEHAKVFADHVDGAPNPRGEVDGLTHVPDVVVKSGASNSLLVEVETEESLQDSPGEAIDQLLDFSKSGYRRVLVVPDAHVDAARKFEEDTEDDLPGNYYLSTPGRVEELL